MGLPAVSLPQPAGLQKMPTKTKNGYKRRSAHKPGRLETSALKGGRLAPGPPIKARTSVQVAGEQATDSPPRQTSACRRSCCDADAGQGGGVHQAGYCAGCWGVRGEGGLEGERQLFL